MSTEPLFWYRPRSDGGYEGPLHSGQIEDVRKASGAWVPLFAGAAPVSAEPVAWMTHHDEPMLFPTEDEARSYCDDEEQPIPLYAAPVAAQAHSEIEITDGMALAFHNAITDGSIGQQEVDEIKTGLRAVFANIDDSRPLADTGLTQQTLDDVKAGIPARDAEIEALRKEIETLQDANKADAGQNYNDGFSDGVILALQLMSMHGDYGGTQYCELLSAAGPNQIVERAISEGMWEMSGLSQTPTAVERRAVIDAARKEQA